MRMDDKMYLTATAQGEVKVTGGRAEEKLGARLQRIGKEFGFFGVLSIFYGVSASFCLFRNPLGITVPLFVAVTYGAAFLIFRKMGVPIKKDSYLLAAVSLLIGLSACFTGNMAVGYYMNRLALILLFCIFILHQCHQDNKWNIGKYMASIVLYLAQAVGMENISTCVLRAVTTIQYSGKMKTRNTRPPTRNETSLLLLSFFISHHLVITDCLDIEAAHRQQD